MNSTDKLIKSLPHIRALFGDDEIQKKNKTYEIFNSASLSKENKVQRLSIANQYDYDIEALSGAHRISNLYYHQLMYNSTSDDKKRRLDDYRSMANYSEVERALTEICNEFFENDDKGQFIKLKFTGDYNSEIQSLIEEEFYKFVEIFKFEEKGHKMVRDWLTEGELFFENIVSLKKPELGIIGVNRLCTDRCDPLYYDLDNELIDCFLLRAKTADMYPFQWGKNTSQASYGTNHNHQILFMNEKQITYVANDQWSDGRKFKLPVLHYAHRPYRQLSLIEDATVIYMLVRAPERLVFKIDVGNMPPSKAEQYMRRVMGQLWSRKTIAKDGRVENVYDPQGMVENFWFPVKGDAKASDVSSIGGGKVSPDNLEILNFFVQKLYQSLKVPLSRLNSETTFGDGESITREELCFAEYIINMQKMWAAAVKRSFIVHLKLKGKKILDSAKRLKMDRIMKNDGTGSAPEDSFEISKVFKDDFNNKCWDYYDTVCEAIEDELIKLENDLANERQEILLDIASNEKVIEEMEDKIIVESHDYNRKNLELAIEQLNSNLNSIEEEFKKIDEIKNDVLSWWEQYDLKEEDIHVKFVEPSQFFALREQQIFNLKYENFSNMSSNDFVSPTLALKKYLGWSDKEILANLDMLKRDAAFRWDLAQIEQNGPDFREKALEELQGTVEAEGGLGAANAIGGMGSGGGPSLPSPSNDLGGDVGGDASAPSIDDTSVPDFGEPPSPPTDSDSGE